MSSGFVENDIGKWRAKKIFYARTLRVLAPHTTNQTISILICSRIDDSLLCQFSQNVLQIDILREIDVYDLVVAGPSALRASEVRSTEACTSGMYYKSIPHHWILCKNGGKIWIFNDRQKRISERPEKVHFWKIHFQNLFQKSKF